MTEAGKNGTAVTVGTFDGVHRGHREVLATLRRVAEERGLRPVVVTFDRHPLEVVAPDRAPAIIERRESRNRMLREQGVEVREVEFSEQVRQKTVTEWLKELRDNYGAKVIVLGYDNTFGSDGRQQTFDYYAREASALGMEAVVAPQVEGCSSSAVRRAVADGDMGKAQEILGRPFSIEGMVKRGRQLGRTIGFPTANVQPTGSRQLLPKPGVYGAEVEIDGINGDSNSGSNPNADSNNIGVYNAIVNVGVNPTVTDSGDLSIEAHILNFEGNLYGRTIKIAFKRRIRDERKFASVADLQSQIARDLTQMG